MWVLGKALLSDWMASQLRSDPSGRHNVQISKSTCKAEPNLIIRAGWRPEVENEISKDLFC